MYIFIPFFFFIWGGLSWHHGVPDDGVSDPAPENQSAEP